MWPWTLLGRFRGTARHRSSCAAPRRDYTTRPVRGTVRGNAEIRLRFISTGNSTVADSRSTRKTSPHVDPTRWPPALFSRSAVQQHPSDVHQPYRRPRMNHSARLLIAATLIFAAGCAKQDWIDRTLITVDVTGTWSGTVEGMGMDGGVPPLLLFNLEQQGSTVTGSMRFGAGGSSTTSKSRINPGPIEGTVAGDIFSFRLTNSGLRGELTVSADEMNGQVSWSGSRPLSLRRVDPSSPPVSPPR